MLQWASLCTSQGQRSFKSSVQSACWWGCPASTQRFFNVLITSLLVLRNKTIIFDSDMKRDAYMSRVGTQKEGEVYQLDLVCVCVLLKGLCDFRYLLLSQAGTHRIQFLAACPNHGD
jgi:hypothetical protein